MRLRISGGDFCFKHEQSLLNGPCLRCEEVAERAAIIEFCGNVSRSEAERLAAIQDFVAENGF